MLPHSFSDFCKQFVGNNDKALAALLNSEGFLASKTGAPRGIRTPDPEARLAKKRAGKEAKLCFAGHVLMENRTGLVVNVVVTRATGTAERETALDMLEKVRGLNELRWERTRATTHGTLLRRAGR